MSTVDYTEQINRGIEFLNKERRGWVDEIDPTKLNLNDVCGCVLGQLYGNFYEAMTELGIWDVEGEATTFGFEGDPFNDLNYRQLTEQWVHRIKELQAA